MSIRTRLDIDLASLDLPWAPGTTYRVELDEGFVIEDGGDLQPSPGNNNLFSFTSNSTGPSATTSVPADGATGVTNLSSVVINFNRTISIGTGFIKLYKVGSPDSLIYSFDVTDSSKVTVGTSSITINVSGYLDLPLTEFYYLLDAGIVEDTDGFGSVQVINADSFKYTSIKQPDVGSITYGTTGSTSIDNASRAILNWDQPVTKLSSGSISVYDSTNALIISRNISTLSVTNNNQINFSYNGLLRENSSYYWKWSADIVENSNNFTNLAFDSTTSASPQIFTTDELSFPGLKANITASATIFANATPRFAQRATADFYSAATISASPNVILNEDRWLTNSSQGTYIEDTAGIITGTPQVFDFWAVGNEVYTVTVDVGTNTTAVENLSTTTSGGGTWDWNTTDTNTLTMSGSKTQVNYMLNNITLLTKPDFVSTFTLNYKIYVNQGGSYKVNKTQTMNLTTPLDTEISNFPTTANYYGKQANYFFASTAITDFDTASGTTYTVTFTASQIGVASGSGFASVTSGADFASTWTYTGTKAEVNAKFADLAYYPGTSQNNTSLISFTQSKSTVAGDQVSRSMSVTFLSNNTSTSSYTFNQLGTFTWNPTFAEQKYRKMDYLIVGHGEDGSHRNTPFNDFGAGRAGGSAKEFSSIGINQSSYTVELASNVSFNGATAISGYTSSLPSSYSEVVLVDNDSSLGGVGASPSGPINSNDAVRRDPNGGRNGDYIGGSGVWQRSVEYFGMLQYSGGGGAGAGGEGGDVTFTTGQSGTSGVGVGGSAGVGYTSTIFGITVGTGGAGLGQSIGAGGSVGGYQPGSGEAPSNQYGRGGRDGKGLDYSDPEYTYYAVFGTADPVPGNLGVVLIRTRL